MKELTDSLTPLYDPREARAVVRMVLEERFGLSFTQQCAYGTTRLSPNERTELAVIMQRLQKGEPVQYVLGTATFCGLAFKVTPATLIPRPETEWIVERLESGHFVSETTVLDIGTGSGCIAIAIAKLHPDWQVYACDISADALAVARENARDNRVNVNFFQTDILCPLTRRAELRDGLDIMVSNPPYVCHSEAAEMTPWVLEHEPHTALFVPDDDPLLFYHAIAQHGLPLLRPDGHIVFETNTRFASDVAAMLIGMGYRNATVHDDMFGRPRFVTAQTSPHHDTTRSI